MRAQDATARAVGCNRMLDSQSRVYSTPVTFTIELEREADGRWLAEVPTLPGVLCYGQDHDEAVATVHALEPSESSRNGSSIARLRLTS